MARRLKKRLRTDSENAYQWFLSLAGEHPVLETPTLSNLTISALLARISRKNPKEARFLRQKLRLLAATEKCISPTPEHVAEIEAGQQLSPTPTLLTLEQFARAGLHQIIVDQVPRSDHDPYTLSDQRKWLVEFFEHHPAPLSAPPRKYKMWLTTNANQLYQGLSTFFCLCQYRESFKGLFENDDDYLDCHGPADLTLMLLTELHQSTRSAIRKVLSHPLPQ